MQIKGADGAATAQPGPSPVGDETDSKDQLQRLHGPAREPRGRGHIVDQEATFDGQAVTGSVIESKHRWPAPDRERTALAA